MSQQTLCAPGTPARRRAARAASIAGLACVVALSSTVSGAAHAASAAVINGDFDVPERAWIRPENANSEFEGRHPSGEFPGWDITALSEQLIVSDTLAWAPAEATGDSFARFSSLTANFEDNRLQQMINLQGESGTLDVQVHLTTHQPKSSNFDAPLSVRVEAQFFTVSGGVATSVDSPAVAIGHLVRRGVEGNDAAGDVTLALDPFEVVALELSALSVPATATHVRVRISGRDRSDGGHPPSGPRFIFFDRVEVAGSGVGALDVANADFGATGDDSREAFFDVVAPFAGGGQGPAGWHFTGEFPGGYADPLPGSVIVPTVHLPEAARFEAHAGQRVWRFQAPPAEFGNGTLAQCLPLAGLDGSIDNTDFNFAVHARTDDAFDGEEVVRLGVEFFADHDACLAHPDEAFTHAFDHALDAADTWTALFTDAVTPAAGDTAVRIAVQARSPGNGEASLYIDGAAAWTLQAPALAFDGGATAQPGDRVDVQVPGLPSGGVSVHFTTDGSDPTRDDEAVSPGQGIALLEQDADGDGNIVIRAAAFKDGWTTSTVTEASFTVDLGPDDDAAPPSGSGGGCTIADPGRTPDATLVLLVLAAGMALLVRRRRRCTA